jgi:hypothetical protein
MGMGLKSAERVRWISAIEAGDEVEQGRFGMSLVC